MILLFETPGLIAWGGVALIALLIFAETGLLLGLIIPGGETLVFTSGILVSTGTLGYKHICFVSDTDSSRIWRRHIGLLYREKIWVTAVR